MIGTALSVILFVVWEKGGVGPATDEKVVVAVSACDLKAGEKLTEPCVEAREVASRYVPPGTLRHASIQPHVGRTLVNDLPVGNAIREEDLK